MYQMPKLVNRCNLISIDLCYHPFLSTGNCLGLTCFGIFDLITVMIHTVTTSYHSKSSQPKITVKLFWYNIIVLDLINVMITVNFTQSKIIVKLFLP